MPGNPKPPEAVEPWMRGPIADLDPVLAPFLYSMTQVREDLHRWVEGLTSDELWARPYNLGSAGFHLRHIGGALERLGVYVEGGQLSSFQLDELKRESEPGATVAQLLARCDAQIAAAEARVRTLDVAQWREARGVGRKGLPTTVCGLVHHMAEHSQRHLGALIVTVKVVRGLAG